MFQYILVIYLVMKVDNPVKIFLFTVNIFCWSDLASLSDILYTCTVLNTDSLDNAIFEIFLENFTSFMVGLVWFLGKIFKKFT